MEGEVISMFLEDGNCFAVRRNSTSYGLYLVLEAFGWSAVGSKRSLHGGVIYVTHLKV
jgi:hypothetical protein